MKLNKSKLKIFILLLIVASGTYIIVASTGLLVEDEAHVLVDEDLNKAAEKAEVNTEKLYTLRSKIEKQIEEDQEIIQNRFNDLSDQSQDEFESTVEDLTKELNNASENLLDLNEEELESLYDKLKKKHEELVKRLEKEQ